MNKKIEIEDFTGSPAGKELAKTVSRLPPFYQGLAVGAIKMLELYCSDNKEKETKKVATQ